MSAKKLRVVELEAKVIKFLRNHPESTSSEVFAATGVGVSINSRFLSHRREQKTGRVLWSINELRYRHFLRTGEINGRASSHYSTRHAEEEDCV